MLWRLVNIFVRKSTEHVSKIYQMFELQIFETFRTKIYQKHISVQSYFITIKALVVPGDIAPDFSLDSVLDGKVESISLSSMKNKYVVLMFYSLDFGYVTPTECLLPGATPGEVLLPQLLPDGHGAHPQLDQVQGCSHGGG